MGRDVVPPVGIAGRRILVTGASRGIGRGLAEAFARAGGDVVLVARPSGALEEAAAVCGGLARPCDLADREAVSALADEVLAEGPVDVLVNNAGISNVGFVLDAGPEDLSRVVDVDLVAPMLLCRMLLPAMVEQGRGHVVNVSSLAAVMSPPGLAAYAAAKSGLSAFTAGLRQDLRGLPIHVTAVHLGSVPTELDDQSRRYGPLRVAAENSKGRDLTPLPVAVEAIVDAVRTGRRDVRLPRAMGPLVGLADVPRSLTRLLFRRYPPRPEQPRA
jgi:short-subunit dehydrogenase